MFPTVFGRRFLAATAIVAAGLVARGEAGFVTEYQDGASWNTIFAQGFSPSVDPTPDPGLSVGATVALSSFEFYKSGATDSATNIRLAIIDGLFVDVSSLTIGSAPVVGVSTSTIASTSTLALGDAISFDFDDLELSFDGDYGAVLVTEEAGGSLTPVLVSALTADYVDDGTGTFRPETNYGTEDDFQYAVSNFIGTNAFGQFFNVFSFAGDANFRAEFSVVPEPAGSLLLLGALIIGNGARRRYAG